MATEVGFKRDIKHLDENAANVMSDPLFEDIHKEASVLFASDRALRYKVAGLRVEQTLASRLLAPPLVGDIDGLRGCALNDGNELHPLRSHLVTKKAVDRAAVFLVGGIYRAQNVELDAMLLQVCPPLHDAVERAFLAAVQTICVVEFTRAVNAQTDQKIMFLEKEAPLVIQKDAVSLKGVFHGLPRLAILFDEFDRAPEKVQFHQRRLASLPRYGYRGRAMRFQQLANISFKRVIRNPIFLVQIQRFIGQEEAICAIDVARGTAWLRK